MHSKAAFVGKTYKWEDLEIIREDCWNSGRLHLKGIVFSSRRMGKNGKVYSTKKIFQSLQFLNCFLLYLMMKMWKEYMH